MAELETQFLEIDGGRRIAFDDTQGPGPVVLGIPGMGDLRSEYRKIRPILTQAGMRLITIDVRGFGQTSADWGDDDKEITAHAVAKDALAVLDHLKIDTVVILGNSFAAGSALWAAHDAPKKVLGAVLLGPIIRDPKISALTKWILQAGFGGPWRVWFWLTYWDSLFPKQKPSDHAQNRQALRNNLQEPSRMEILARMVTKVSKADTEALLPQSKVPTLSFLGTKDPDYTDVKAEAEFVRSSLNGQVTVLDGVGHYPHVEVVEEVGPKIVEFIKEVNNVRSSDL